jgi:LPPG:FO 2-phospho-L-lactate transferase
MMEGATLSQVTAQLCEKFGVKNKLVPMTDQKVRTKIVSGNQIIDFQDYFVKNKTKNEVTNVLFEGAAEARPAPGIIEALSQADRIIVCPSNPILSIGPMLAIPEIRREISRRKADTVAISPVVAGKTLRGPADKILLSMGYEASVQGVAKYYRGLIDRIIIDQVDARQEARIERLGLKVTVSDTVMKCLEDSIDLARVALKSG